MPKRLKAMTPTPTRFAKTMSDEHLPKDFHLLTSEIKDEIFYRIKYDGYLQRPN